MAVISDGENIKSFLFEGKVNSATISSALYIYIHIYTNKYILHTCVIYAYIISYVHITHIIYNIFSHLIIIPKQHIKCHYYSQKGKEKFEQN